MPAWAKTVNINQFMKEYYDNKMTWEEARDAIVKTLEADPEFSKYCALEIEEMRDADTTDEFDSALASIYDFADENRIWLGL